MDYLNMNVGHLSTGKWINCICLHYHQFVTDANKLTDARHKGFGINPIERFNEKVGKILYEIANGERSLPSRFQIRLESKHSICRCRIDYVFEVMEKDFLQGNIRGTEIPEETLKVCLDSDSNLIMLYVGMNR
ncbi:hypothetical protein I6G82_12360 [Lysinibacillus macroides]|uniref:Uncharacterized protein n=1 Tax=Lysinibacillus macroides TaxID=33935 RepID=A0A0M9DLY3_9BACI|nr:hypothetical protein [Lysinibacillus macroides]KOY82852.1 hypothetical protein ADM90_05900 [Lysinibacillus macroides]QPR66098.1 hypothetical protein I6G82_12360 [Lysinibacillus macroides]